MLVLDDLGILCPSSTQETPEVPRDAAEASMVSWVSDLIDSLRPAGQLPLPGGLAHCASCCKQAIQSQDYEAHEISGSLVALFPYPIHHHKRRSKSRYLRASDIPSNEAPAQ